MPRVDKGRPPTPLLLFATLLLLVATGCRAAMRSAATEAPRAAVPAAVDETLKAGEDPRTRERVAAVLATPEMQSAIAEVAKAAVAAALVEAASDESESRITELTHVVGRALAESIARDVVPALVAGTRDSVRARTSAGDMKALESAVGSLAAASTTAAMRAAATELPKTLGPAARESLAHELQSPDLHEAVASLVGDAARQVLTSSRQAVTDGKAENGAAEKPGLIEEARRMLTLSWVLAFAFGVVVVGLGAWALSMRRRTKRYRGALLDLVATKKKDVDEDDPARVQRLLELLQ